MKTALKELMIAAVIMAAVLIVQAACSGQELREFQAFIAPPPVASGITAFEAFAEPPASTAGITAFEAFKAEPVKAEKRVRVIYWPYEIPEKCPPCKKFKRESWRLPGVEFVDGLTDPEALRLWKERPKGGPVFRFADATSPSGWRELRGWLSPEDFAQKLSPWFKLKILPDRKDANVGHPVAELP